MGFSLARLVMLMVGSPVTDETDALRTSSARWGRWTIPLTGPPTIELARSLLMGDRRPASGNTISPASTLSTEPSPGRWSGTGCTGGVEFEEKVKRRNRFACSLDRASFPDKLDVFSKETADLLTLLSAVTAAIYKTLGRATRLGKYLLGAFAMLAVSFG